MASEFVYWISDGGGADGGGVLKILHEWITKQGNARLIVHGGDIYNDGKKGEFKSFLQQVGGSVSNMCETAGNHDWHDRADNTERAFPRGYEDFWSKQKSQQPLKDKETAGARYEHAVQVNGWKLIFIDSGALDFMSAWPFGNSKRKVWLEAQLSDGGRSRMVFAHYSRLTWGKHDDADGLNTMWRSLFTETGEPRVALTMAGHNHNVSLYMPRDRDLKRTSIEKGVQIWVNGRGGAGFYKRKRGTPPEVFPPDGDPAQDSTDFCVSQIELIDPTHARVKVQSLGNPPRADRDPKTLVDISYAF